jgi:KDO2-lipid IV(A) lauroyltransferase
MRKTINTIAFICLYSVTYIVSLLPMRILYGISNIAYLVILYVVGYRKTVVIQNLARSFPGMNYEDIEITMREFYHAFTDNFVEMLKAISIPYPQLANQVTLINFDIVTEQIKQGKNVIVSMGHCGNWELMNVLPAILQINSYAVYQPLKSKVVNRLCLILRTRFGMQLIPASSVVRHFLSNKDNPALYLFLADQCPRLVEPWYRFNLLNQETSTFSGMEKLARSSGTLVVYIHVLKTARGLYSAECKIVHSDSKLTKRPKSPEITFISWNLISRSNQVLGYGHTSVGNDKYFINDLYHTNCVASATAFCCVVHFDFFIPSSLYT